ncbi:MULTISPECIES: ABC transporter ATP-binding protein [Cyanophyceae]|uniref:ABC transporter ATP-binding protein n=1 Tax=Cyanophyceae TaxID=3028117 RepID=UPI0016844132|nr:MULTISPECIES: ABC transporter ATP-binding protein [Cyanophyceae]MBD1918271.1 ABC transporter ATP-binding protein [Phormidium sp. FACHB-77]MBD2031315.1 ABC transporter ATP-binding protein [Phormidium sp. FACHB-322]MBD2052382.1 ABC transporter ATP-binding protein [Leptolyngbya sp. FACHB-60]
MGAATPAYRTILATYLKPQRGRFGWLAIALLGGIGLQLLNPQILRYFIDTAIAGGQQQSLLWAAGAFMAIAILQQGLAIATTYFSETIAWRATNTLRLDLARHALGLDLAFHKAHTPGELVERADGDVDALSRFFSQFVLQVVGNGLLVVGVLLMVWREDWRAGVSLSLFALVAFGVLGSLQTLAVGPWGTYRQISAEFYGFVAEHLSGLEDIRANGAVGYVMDRFYKILRRWLAAFHQARFTSTLLWGSTVGLFTVGNAIALAVGAYLWSQAAITIGTVYLLFYYATLLQDPIERIREELEQLQQAQASIQRIQDLLGYQTQVGPGGQGVLPTGALSVELEEVWFGYGEKGARFKVQGAREEGDLETSNTSLKERFVNQTLNPTPETLNQTPYTLQSLTLHLPAGQTLGLLGRTGSGKSTLARLLLRLYDIQRGQICLGGVDIAQVPLRELPHHVGFVTQDVQLFQTSVRNNLTFFNGHIGDRAILQTLEDLGLMPWLEALPAGLDTELGADSGGLSAGQAQLLAFARVFLKDPGLVVLDEASSRLDPLTEQMIERAVDRLLVNRTGIIIAHRLKTVERADQILILEQGQAVEYGDRISLAQNPASRFAHLLQIGTVAGLEIGNGR